ncbi:MAG: family peptidase [Alphaproteobacteria bacterium]|nr:family peptidase [Alphaproteobacteria bacterium]
MTDPRPAAPLIAALTAALMAASPVASAADSPAAGIDPATRPGDDFYMFANRSWLKSAAIPEGRSSYDSFVTLKAQNAARVRALIRHTADDAAAGRSPEGSIARKIGDYYAGWMDSAAIEAKGLTPLSPALAAIAAIGDRRSLSAYLGSNLHPDDGTDTQTDFLFGLWIHQGFDESDRYLPHLVQGGLGLPDRDDYLEPGAEQAERRILYRSHVAAILKLAGRDRAEERAARVLALETAIARTHASLADTADPFKTDNKWRRADFAAKAPGMDWTAYFAAAGLGRQQDFLVWQPSAVTGTAALAATQPLDVWKDYLVFHLVAHDAAVLPRAFGDERSRFLGRLSGTRQSADRAALAIAGTEAALGEAVGRLYVAQYFPPSAKAAVLAMTANLRAAFRARIPHAAWMSPATRQKALAKLAALRIGIGYPDAWTDYSRLRVVRGDAYGNLRRAEDFDYRRNLAKLQRRVDPGEWAILPQGVSAILLFSPNAMQFSAGVLQPPLFDPGGDAASNYGSAGAGIAHEISHSFDELGNLFDAQGRLGNWWTAPDLARYRAATAPLVGQMGAYCPAAGLCLDGARVLSESAADLAGLTIAHDAWLLSLRGRPDVLRGGLTGERRFYLAFARRWRRLQTEAALRRQVVADIHPPGEYRSDAVRNMDAWYAAYGIRPGDKLYLAPDKRIRLW